MTRFDKLLCAPGALEYTVCNKFIIHANTLDEIKSYRQVLQRKYDINVFVLRIAYNTLTGENPQKIALSPFLPLPFNGITQDHLKILLKMFLVVENDNHENCNEIQASRG